MKKKNPNMDIQNGNNFFFIFWDKIIYNFTLNKEHFSFIDEIKYNCNQNNAYHKRQNSDSYF